MSARQKVRAFGPEDEKVRVVSETRDLALPIVAEPPAAPPDDTPIVTQSGDVILPPTVGVNIDPTCGLAEIYLRTPDGREFAHPVSAERCIKIAYDLLLAASRNMMPPGLLLAINALRGCVFARKTG